MSSEAASAESKRDELYRKKYKMLKRRYDDLEEDNFQLSIKLSQVRDHIAKLRKERRWVICAFIVTTAFLCSQSLT